MVTWAISAALELDAKNAAKALEILQTAAAPYELGQCEAFQLGMLYPMYLRGQTYLLARRGSEAATEFQHIIDHRGIVLNFPLGALAELGLGRAYALQGDSAKARSAYQNFLALWKDADPDIPVLEQASTRSFSEDGPHITLHAWYCLFWAKAKTFTGLERRHR